jgi:hypothetical protein
VAERGQQSVGLQPKLQEKKCMKKEAIFYVESEEVIRRLIVVSKKLCSPQWGKKFCGDGSQKLVEQLSYSES